MIVVKQDSVSFPNITLWESVATSALKTSVAQSKWEVTWFIRNELGCCRASKEPRMNGVDPQHPPKSQV